MFLTTIRKSLRFHIVLLWCFIAASTILVLQYKYKNDNKHINIASVLVNPFNESEIIPKYVRLWTQPTQDPINNLGEEEAAFIGRNCPIYNCYVSVNRAFLSKITDYDVIVFHGPGIKVGDLPSSRSQHQKYVYASMESSDYYPMCNKTFNDFFNWTWTYKLNSDVLYVYISIWNKEGEIIGPNEIMHWKKVEEMEPIADNLKKKLSSKKYAAAWFVSNCKTHVRREFVAYQLKQELMEYDLTLDIYGNCGRKKCPKYNKAACLEILETDYYFYLSFENSFSTDYVTEKLLHPLQHYTIPVVFGSANYTRFMPDGIYLNARELPIFKLAAQMAELINNKEKYFSYFKWHNHYSYHGVNESPKSDSYCKLCSMINDEKRAATSVYPNFVEWWNPRGKCL